MRDAMPLRDAIARVMMSDAMMRVSLRAAMADER